MGTPEIGVPSLKKLNEEHEIVMCITQPDRPKGRGKKLQSSPVKITAEELGIKVFQPEDINSKESLSIIKNEEIDVIIVIAYGQILSEEFLKIPKYCSINLHASLLPKYRGASPVQTAILMGEETTGITVMEIEKGLDSGAVLLQEEIAIEEKTSPELFCEMGEKGAILLSTVLKDFNKYYSERIPQEEAYATFCGKYTKEDGLIDWNESAREICCKIRGLQPFPVAYSTMNDETWKIYRAEVEKYDKEVPAGTIIEVGKDYILVKAGVDAIKILELQVPGKRKMATRDFLAGNKIEEGERFR